IMLQTPDYGELSDVSFEVKVILNDKMNYENVKGIYRYLENELRIKHIGERFSFLYSDEEYDKASHFVLYSTGNSGGAFLKDKGTQFKNNIFCDACGLILQNQVSPLTIDTSKIKDRYMVNVGAFWVVSEKMAELMNNWGITGYELKPVIHKGTVKGKQPAYQIIPTNTLPSWSNEMKHYYFATEEQEQCKDCGIRGRIDGPYIYIQKDLIDAAKDIYLPQEWTHNGKYVYRKTLFSKKFRDLIIENKISRDIRKMSDFKYGSQDWVFKPILLI
ncbi:hypothetical protein, partial [Bacillus sp. JJ1474]|uniref:hypothetical protein n=1 Tax=Bacillus sp. JJ1474 TaxID=3122955 RepID=UPI002FFF9261